MKITFYLLAAGLLGVALLETLWIAASAAVRRRPVGAALLERWKNEELFFPHLLPRVRPRVGEALAYAFLVSELCWSAVGLLIDQAAPGMSEAWPAVVQAALSCALVLAKGLGCTEYSGRQLAALAALMGLFALIVPNVGGYANYLCYPVCVIVMFKDVRLAGKLRLALILSLADIAVHAALSLAGRIPDNLFGWTDRMGLGYSHPNSLGVAVVTALALYIALRYPAWRWWDTLVGVAALVFLYLVPYSRTAVGVAAVMVVLAAASRMCPRVFETGFCRECLALSWPVLGVVSLWMGALYEHIDILSLVNKALSGRLRFFSYAWNYSGWEWLGTKVDGTVTWTNIGDVTAWEADAALGLHNYHLVDLGYGFLFFMGGPLFLAVLLGGFWLTIRRLLRSGRENWGLAIMCVGFGFQLVCEHILLPVFPLALLGIALFGKNQKHPLSMIKTENRP